MPHSRFLGVADLVITVRLSGGLGNQMFQYAAGLAVAIRQGSELHLDARSYQRDRLRKFGLSHFGLEPTVSPDIVKTWPPTRRGLLNYSYWKLRHGAKVEYARERTPSRKGQLTTVGPIAYLHGYWQSQNYFADHADQIRQAFQIQSKPSAENQRWLERIQERSSVSVHVRRSDYTTDIVNKSLYASCDIGYYREAADHMAAGMSSQPYFVVFSDDPDWAASNLRFPGDVDFISHNTGEAYIEDLRLMTACNHHIIANSTFSWWGAWLGKNPERTIVAPSCWYRDSVRDQQNPIPSDWIRIAVAG